MQVETKNRQCIAVPLSLSGDAVDEFHGRLEEAFAVAEGIVTLDCSQLKNVVSSHINLLWMAYLRSEEAHIKVRLKDPSPGLLRVLQVLDLYELFVTGMGLSEGGVDRAKEPTRIEDSYSDEFSTSVTAIDKATESFLAYLKRIDLPKMTTFELRTIFYEVATNIRSHAEIEGRSTISFSVRPEGERLILKFTDTGRAFDPAGHKYEVQAERAAEARQRRGFGLALIHRLADRVSYKRKEDTINVLTVEKKWRYQS